MSENKTLYTMSEIRDSVKNLKNKSINGFYKNLETEFEKNLEANNELSLDIKTYESLCTQLHNLEKKHITNGSWTYLNTSSLRNGAFNAYKRQFGEVKQKINTQFDSILKRLSTMRKPETALEFLKACGIELPEKVAPVIQIPVDPEFIKSILPKQNLLSDGLDK